MSIGGPANGHSETGRIETFSDGVFAIAITVAFSLAFFVPALSLALVAGLALLFVLPEPSGMEGTRLTRAEEPAGGE